MKTTLVRPGPTASVAAPSDFSLVLGGPLFQALRRARLAGESLEFVHRRVMAAALISWLPLLLLTAFDGTLRGSAITIPFLYDIEAHVRFLIALPLLILAEVVVHQRISPLVRRFVARGIVRADDVPAFNAAVRSTMRARNSRAFEVVLLILVYTLGLWLWRSELAESLATWYADADATHFRLTPAGRWYAFVSIPMFQFVLLRWYGRLVLWFHLLWRISRLNLHLSGAHPDRAGGIGFLGRSAYAFSPILFAQGTLLSGLIASRVLYAGQNLKAFTFEAVGLIAAAVLFVLGPLVMFSPHLDRARRKASAGYGLLASRTAFAFEAKWMQEDSNDTEDALATHDLQSFADLAAGYEVVAAMRLVPFGKDDVLRLVAATAAPLLPLGLTMFSVQDLTMRLIKVLL